MCWRKSKRADELNANRQIHISGDGKHGDLEKFRAVHTQCKTCHPDFEFTSNYVSTTKYNVVTFLPKNLFEQFQKKANLYFLIVAIISLTPLSPKTPFVSVAPLVFVLAVSAIKEAVEDYARYKMDREINNSLVQVWRDQTLVDVTWQNIAVGDLVYVRADQAFPADIVMLKSSAPQGSCTIETANLDGETNLKVKQSAPETYSIQCREDGSDYIRNLPPCVVESSPPNKRLDESSSAWSGNLSWLGKSQSESDKVALGMNQLLLRGCMLRNTKWIIGFVVFTGQDTKLMLNSTLAKHKRSNVDRIVDRALYVLFSLQAGLCTMGAVLNYRWLSTFIDIHWYLDWEGDMKAEAAKSILTYLVLLDILIPISLYVSMELVKFVQAWYISQDTDMYHEQTNTPAKARTSNLNEELGQIQYIFSDKTGTLTANIMKFIAASCNGVAFTESDEKLTEQVQRGPGIPPAEDLPFKDTGLQVAIAKNTELGPFANEFLTLLATCHTVLPDFPECDRGHIHRYEDCKKDVEYQAASPDEKALVIAAKNNQYYFYHSTPREYKFGDLFINGTAQYVNIFGVHYEFAVYEVAKFDSERARMSVILHDPRDDKIKIYVKGSDTKMIPLLTKESKGKVLENTTAQLTEFAKLGLRTLVVAYKEISTEFFVQWMTKHKAALAAVDDRHAKVQASYAAIEGDLTLLGATAIEDKLQEGVPNTIATLARAGIKIWVLTGDKVETAVNIGRSCKLLTEEMEKSGFIKLIVKDDIPDEQAQADTLAQLKAAVERLRDEKAPPDHLAVVVSGRALSFIFGEKKVRGGRGEGGRGATTGLELQLQFLSICQRCKAVICCRVSPHQKAEVVNLVKKNVHGAITLAIGDGANDVSMIKAAHVGIGISGLEGLQAVMASDYAIAQFRFLEKLLLVHGQWSYRRTSLLILYSFYKNVAIALTQIWFAIESGFSAQMFYDPYAGSCYNMIFTAFPVMLAAIFNKDVSKERTLLYPELYRSGLINECFNLKLLARAIIEGLIQSVICFYISIKVFSDNGGISQADGMSNDVWIASTAMYSFLIIVVSIRIGLDTKTWNWISYLFMFLSILSWFCFALIYSTIIYITPDMYYVSERLFGDINFWLLMFLVPGICNLPDLAWRYVRRMYFPRPIDIVAEMDRVRPAVGAHEREPSTALAWVRTFAAMDQNPVVWHESTKSPSTANRRVRIC